MAKVISVKGPMSHAEAMGKFSRMIRGNKVARQMVQRKVSRAKVDIAHFNKMYRRMLHAKKASGGLAELQRR